MLWVPLQELVGKRIILFFEGKYYSQYEAGFLNVLRNSYARMKYLKKGTYDDEFEVIYITRKGEALYEDMIFDVPWLFALESQTSCCLLILVCVVAIVRLSSLFATMRLVGVVNGLHFLPLIETEKLSVNHYIFLVFLVMMNFHFVMLIWKSGYYSN
ncbi:hypothetical protein OROHE_015117 [Orobanche hederae]